jgi:hypothetical protein
MEEPSVLDYLKSKLMPWKYERLEIPSSASAGDEPGRSQIVAVSNTPAFQPENTRTVEKPLSQAISQPLVLPWRSLAALLFALIAQYSLAPRPYRTWTMGVAFLLISFAFLVWSMKSGEMRLAPLPEVTSQSDPATIRFFYLAMGVILMVFSYLSFNALQFSLFNLFFLGIVLLFVAQGFHISKPGVLDRVKAWVGHLHGPPWKITSTGFSIAAILTIGWIIFFRFYRLGSVPPEMNSDHAEKFLDVLRLLSGNAMIFFPSNGGREALEFYLVAGFHTIFGIPLNFMILKLVTSLVGLLALPFLYLLGKELGSRRIGLLAALFAGIAYWPNVVSRFGLRLPFYIFFTAAMLYYLVRGLRRGSRNDMILAGIFLGLSFYGYSADRILPLLVVIAIGLYIVHRQPAERRLFALVSLTAIVVVSVVIFIPLLHYIISQPELFFMRTFTRMGNWERPIENPVAIIFLQNAGRALAMFSWDAGVVWPISIPHYPALSTVSGGLFYLGLGLVLLRYLIRRNWEDLLLLLSIPVLLLPSMLSIAFPSENPNLYRTSGAVVPVFLLIAFALDSLMSAIESGARSQSGERLAAGLSVGLACLLVAINSQQDYTLVFKDYQQNYLISSWNSSEMGQAARGFIQLFQAPDNVWVVGYANWVDTRLVANNAGYPDRDYELKPENMAATVNQAGPKLFILNPEDYASLETLQSLYPSGLLERYKSKVETKDFLLFYVLPGGPD